MTTTLQRLVSYPHAAAFDKSAQEELVFRLNHPDGASWVISEAVMTASGGSVSSVYDLSGLTVAELIVELQSDGFIVTETSSAYAALSALVLVEGTGDEGVSNGNRVTGYTSLMWVLMGGYAGVIREAGLQVIQALRQMIITQAEGEWLDLWGKLYGVPRRQNETDQNYAPRIPREAFRLRESPIAIEEAVFDETGKVIRIEEPWQSIFRLDQSVLSGAEKFQDGNRIGYFLIQPTSTSPIDWTDVLPVIHRNRAAGIVVLPPFSRNASRVNANIAGIINSTIASIHSRVQRYEDRTLLDFSLIEDVPILNHSARHRQTILHTSHSRADSGWSDVIWPDIPWPETPYFVHSSYYRSYRVYGSHVSYESQYWTNIAWVDVTWDNFNVLIGSTHSRS